MLGESLETGVRNVSVIGNGLAPRFAHRNRSNRFRNRTVLPTMEIGSAVILAVTSAPGKKAAKAGASVLSSSTRTT